MKITLTKKQWDGIGKTAGRTKWPINPNAVDERAVDITKLVDYYQKADRYQKVDSEYWAEPCNTCTHRNEKLYDKEYNHCPCFGCIHYFETSK